MSSSLTPIDHAPNHAGGSQEPSIKNLHISPSPSDDIYRYLMNQTRHAQLENTPHTPQLSTIGNTCFVDFSYSYPNGTSTSGVDGVGNTKMEHQSDQYIISSGGVFPENRGSIASATGRASFSSGGPLYQVQDGSVEESDDASPESNQGRGVSTGDVYVDEFGMRDIGGDGSDLGSKTKDDRDGPTPPWGDLKTKAGKERKRLPLACIACRRKKIRCSGEKPACKHCLKSRIPCVYKVTMRKAAPRTDYMAMLDKRLKRMEERIIKIVPKEEHDPVAVIRAQVKPLIPGTTPVRPVAGKKRMAEEAFGAELDAWAKSNSKGNNDEQTNGTLHPQEVEESRLLSEGADVMPSQEIQEHLAEVFFDNLYGQSYHLLHKPSFMRKLKSGTVPPVLMLSVCAVSARFSTHPKLNSAPAFLRGESWAAEARDIVMKRFDWPNITILTCLLLLALHEFGTCYGGRSWALGGMAIRMAYTLQLHKDLEYDPMNRTAKVKLSFIDREIRRRTMWACFLMDRFTSSGTTRPMFMKEETLLAQLPIKEKYFQLDIEGSTEDLQGAVPNPVPSGVGQLPNAKENMGVAAFTIRSISMWGRIVIYLFQSGREPEKNPMWAPEAKFFDLDKKAHEFVKSLPDSLKFTPENLDTHETEGLSSQFLFLHMSLQQNILFLNHIAAHAGATGNSSSEVPREFVANSTAKAFEAGKRISDILKNAESHPVNAPFGGYCAFWSSSVQIPAVFSKNSATETAAKKNLATNVRYLSCMKRYWGAFHWTSEHLKEQFKAYADAARHGAGGNDSATAFSSIYHYGDWFDRYPHGVSQTDFEDPEASIKKEKGDDAVLEEKSDYHTVEEFFNTLSPAPFQPQEHRPAKRKGSKKNTQVPQQRPRSQPNNPENIVASPPEQMVNTDDQQMAQVFNQINPENGPSLYTQPAYYEQENIFQAPQPSMVPVDRQFVFGGAYPPGTDPFGFGGQNLIYNPAWDIDMSNMGGFEEPMGSWFVPFTMEPPSLGQDIDVFNSMGGVGDGGGTWDGRHGNE